MFKSASWWALLSAFGIFIILGTSLPGVLLSMIITGVIPGTTYELPLWVILTIYPVVAGAAFVWIVRQTIFIGETGKPLRTATVIKPTTSKKKKPALKQPALKRRPRTAL